MSDRTPPARDLAAKIDEALAEIEAVQEDMVRSLAEMLGPEDASVVARQMRRRSEQAADDGS